MKVRSQLDVRKVARSSQSVLHIYVFELWHPPKCNIMSNLNCSIHPFVLDSAARNLINKCVTECSLETERKSSFIGQNHDQFFCKTCFQCCFMFYHCLFLYPFPQPARPLLRVKMSKFQKIIAFQLAAWFLKKESNICPPGPGWLRMLSLVQQRSEVQLKENSKKESWQLGSSAELK